MPAEHKTIQAPKDKAVGPPEKRFKMQKGLHFFPKILAIKDLGEALNYHSGEDMRGFGASEHRNTSTCFPHSRNGI